MKNKILSGLVLGGGTLIALISPLLVLGGVTGPGPQYPSGGENITYGQLSGIFCTIVQWVFTILIILTTIYVLWAAYLYLTSSGDEEKIKKANHTLFYAAIALIVAIIARGVPFLINSIVGATTIQGC